MKDLSIEELDFEKGQGLIPVVVQDIESNLILTVAYVNREALERTLRTGFAHYYRRSHGKVMMKGVTSGNTQRVLRILADCDNDALIFQVNQKGHACHLGTQTCFNSNIPVTDSPSDI